MSIGPTHVGHYRRFDYASLQKMVDENGVRHMEERDPVYYRNKKYEGQPDKIIDPGLRTLFSLQLSNNEHIFKALVPETSEIIDPIFSVGLGPKAVGIMYPDNYLKNPDNPMYNLRYDKDLEDSLDYRDIYTADNERTSDVMNPRPAVKPGMFALGDAISMTSDNTLYVMNDDEGVPKVKPL